MKPVLLIAGHVATALATAVLLAQGSDVAEVDRARVEAIHVGGDVGAFYTRDYLGVMASGAFEDWAGAATAVRPGGNPGFRLSVDRVRLFDDVAIETGTQWPNVRAVKFLRVWTKTDGRWKVWAHHGTAIDPESAARSGTPALVTKEDVIPTGPTGAAIAVSERQHRASAPRNGSIRVVYERIHGYTGVGVAQGTTWTEAGGPASNPTRFTRVWIRDRGVWVVLEDYRTAVAAAR